MTVQIHEKVLTTAGIKHLLDYMNKNDDYSLSSGVVKKQGFVWGKNDWPHRFLSQILHKVGVYTSPYSIFMTALDYQLTIHTDTLEGERCDKNIIIPLEIEEEAATVIFKNKWFGKTIALNHENKKDLDFLSNKPFNKKIYDKYLSNFEYELLQGLEIEEIYHWKIGSVCVFDSQHIHTNASLSKAKKAVNIWTIH